MGKKLRMPVYAHAIICLKKIISLYEEKSRKEHGKGKSVGWGWM